MRRSRWPPPTAPCTVRSGRAGRTEPRRRRSGDDVGQTIAFQPYDPVTQRELLLLQALQLELIAVAFLDELIDPLVQRPVRCPQLHQLPLDLSQLRRFGHRDLAHLGRNIVLEDTNVRKARAPIVPGDRWG